MVSFFVLASFRIGSGIGAGRNFKEKSTRGRCFLLLGINELISGTSAKGLGMEKLILGMVAENLGTDYADLGRIY